VPRPGRVFRLYCRFRLYAGVPPVVAGAVYSRATVDIQSRFLRIPIDLAVTGIIKPSVIVLNQTSKYRHSVEFSDRWVTTGWASTRCVLYGYSPSCDVSGCVGQPGTLLRWPAPRKI
jgi:hypothetical protein